MPDRNRWKKIYLGSWFQIEFSYSWWGRYDCGWVVQEHVYMVVCRNREYLIGISSGITFKDQLIVTLFCCSYSIYSLHKNNTSWGPTISNKIHEHIGNILDANYTTCTHRGERVKSFSPASLISKCTQTVFLYHYLEIHTFTRIFAPQPNLF